MKNVIDSSVNARNQALKESATIGFNNARLIGIAVNNPKRFPANAADYYPWIETPQEQMERSKRAMQQIMLQNNAVLAAKKR